MKYFVLQSGVLVLGWVISQPAWYRHLWHRENKSESKEDFSTNFLALLSKLTNGQTLAYICLLYTSRCV